MPKKQIDYTCAKCGKSFRAEYRPKVKKRYCSSTCQTQGQDCNDDPDEQEILRRARILRELRESGTTITAEMLDWRRGGCDEMANIPDVVAGVDLAT